MSLDQAASTPIVLNIGETAFECRRFTVAEYATVRSWMPVEPMGRATAAYGDVYAFIANDPESAAKLVAMVSGKPAESVTKAAKTMADLTNAAREIFLASVFGDNTDPKEDAATG